VHASTGAPPALLRRLAVGRELALRGRTVYVVDRADRVGAETSSRNSGVIHAGLYYPEGSLKARLCVAGRPMLYDYLESRGVDFARTGKLVVATGATQRARLAQLRATAEANGVRDLRVVSGGEAAAMEPELRCEEALFSPSTGVFDVHGAVSALRADLEAAGGAVVLDTEVTGGGAEGGRVVLETRSGAERLRLRCRTVVNAAGLWAQVAAAALGVPPATVPRLHMARGCYFAVSGDAPFSRPIYPLPEPGGLGIHYTGDLAGRGRFGPSVEWVPGEDPGSVGYDVDPAAEETFRDAVRGYFPGVDGRALTADYCGVRPKVVGPGGGWGDFAVHGMREHGVPGLVCLYGVESPGLTACLSLADHVAGRC